MSFSDFLALAAVFASFAWLVIELAAPRPASNHYTKGEADDRA